MRRRASLAHRASASIQAARAASQRFGLGGGAEDGEDAVAHELEHLPAFALDRIDQDLGMVVEQAQDLGVAGEQLQHAGTGDLVGQPGEAGEIAVPDHGMDHLDLAALHVAAEHATGRVRTEIGGEERAGGGGAERGGGHDRQDRLDGPYPLQVGVGEAAWAVGDPGGEDAGAVNQRHAGCQARAQGQVVGCTLCPQVTQDRELIDALAVAQPTAQTGSLGLLQMMEWAVAPGLVAAHGGARCVVEIGAPVGPPDHQGGIEQRVDETRADCGPGEGQAAVGHRPAERC